MKKTLALGMAAAMTATLLAGCGGSASSAASTAESTAASTEATSTAESTGSYTDYSAGFPENVTIQIPVYDRGFEGWNPTDNYYTKWIQSEFGDKYNVTVKYVAIARSNEVQDFNQMIAAGNAPSIIFHYDMPQAVNYWSEGAMQPIDLDEVAFYAPTYSFYMSNGTDVFDSLKANDPNAEVAVLGSTVSGTVADGYTAHYYEYPSYGMIMGINANATDEERAATYMFLDWMSQPENLTYLQHGIEGETYTVDADGIATQISDYSGDAKLSQNNNKDYWCLVQEVMGYGDKETDLKANKSLLAPDGYDWIIDEAYDICEKGIDGGLITPIFTKAVESTSEYSTDLNSLWQEAYVDCITCSPDQFESKYAEYSQEYLDAGYQEILDEKQSLIDEGAVLVVK